MDENMEIKSVSARKKVALAVSGGLVALIVLIYLGLCIYVGASHTVLPGVRAAQVDLGGMSRERAVQAMDEWLEDGYAGAEP